MNSYQQARREKLAELLSDPRVPYEDVLESVGQFVEEAVQSAYYRGLRGVSNPRLSALQAGKLVRANTRGRA